MPPPTTGVYFNTTAPAAPPGNQNITFQSDGAQPEQAITAFPQMAVAPSGGVAGLLGVSFPDGTTIGIKPDGTLYAITAAGGGTGGTGGDGTSASGGFLVCVVPQGAKDGSNTQYTLPAPVLAGTGYLLVRNGVTQKQLGSAAEYAVQGTTITTATPLQSTDWQEFYYVQGQPNSQGGGGGTVPTTGPIIRGSSANGIYGATTISCALPAGTVAGDFAVGFLGHNNSSYTLSTSGWTQVSHFNSIWGGEIFYKVLTSADIALGSVTCTMSVLDQMTMGLVTFIGGTGGVRETEYGRTSGPGVTITNTTTSAVLSTDVIVYYYAGLANVGTPTITPASGSATTLQSTSFPAPTTSTTVALLADQQAPGGALSVATFFSASPGFAAQVVVQA